LGVGQTYFRESAVDSQKQLEYISIQNNDGAKKANYF